MAFCEHIARELFAFAASVTFCGPDEAGYEVLTTPFVYPDRDNIQLFVKEVPDHQILVTDLGQTMTKLSEYGFVPANAPRRRAMINQIVSSMGVRYDRGVISLVVDSGSIRDSSAPPATGGGSRIWDLAIALQRLSDLAFTVPAYARATFTDEFENFMLERDISYRRAGRIELATGYSFAPDFVVGTTKILQLLSGASAGYARERLDRVYVNFNELEFAKDDRERLAVVDDTHEVWQSMELIAPLAHVGATILQWSNRRAIVRALQVA
jgi:Domain of unknown function DUF1828